MASYLNDSHPDPTAKQAIKNINSAEEKLFIERRRRESMIYHAVIYDNDGNAIVDVPVTSMFAGYRYFDKYKETHEQKGLSVKVELL